MTSAAKLKRNLRATYTARRQKAEDENLVENKLDEGKVIFGFATNYVVCRLMKFSKKKATLNGKISTMLGEMRGNYDCLINDDSLALDDSLSWIRH